MINQGLKMLKRAIDERPKGGMQTGVPKIQLREADAVRAVAELEWAQARIAELESKIASKDADLLERDGKLAHIEQGEQATIEHQREKIEQQQREIDALAAHVEQLSKSLLWMCEVIETDFMPYLEDYAELQDEIDEAKNLVFQSPTTSLNALRREVYADGFMDGQSDYVDPSWSEAIAKANTKYPTEEG